MSNPLVTIITAVFNGEQFLEDAIISIKQQTYPNIQYIIIDGGSTDGTLDIIKKSSDSINFWISEKDDGIADAWNKGLKLAKGNIIGFLNADDYYSKDSIDRVVKNLKPEETIVTYGKTIFNDRKTGKEVLHCDNEFNLKTIYDGFNFVHTTCFAPKKVYEKVGNFDTKYKIAIDTDFLLRCLKYGIKFKHVDNETYMRTGGLSDKMERIAISEFYSQLIYYGYSKTKILKALVRRYRKNPSAIIEVISRLLFSEIIK